MKVLLVSPSGALGGAERVLLNLVASVGQLNPTIQWHAILFEDGPLVAQLRDLGVSVRVIPMPAAIRELGEASLSGPKIKLGAKLLFSLFLASLPLRRMLRQLKNSIRETQPDIIHSNGMKAHVLTAQVLGKKERLVWHMHEFVSARAITRLLRHYSGRVNEAIAVSNAVAADVKNHLPQVSVRTVLNAVDLSKFHPGAKDPSRLGENDEAHVVRIGLIATYARWKGQDTFIEALRLLRSSNPKRVFRAYIVGGAIYATAASQFSRAELEGLVASSGLGEFVRFMDFAHDVAPIYRAMDIVVHASSKPEPFGLVVAEAMACGCAVIVSRSGGARELYTEGFDAVGFEPGDAPSLAEALGRLATDSELRARLGRSAATTAARRFDRSRFGKELLAVYEDLLKDRR